MGNTRKLVLIGLLVSLGLILHFVEAMLPVSMLVPGAKLGLANIVNLIALVIIGFKGGLLIFFLRVFLGSLFAGTFLSINFYLSLGGGLTAYLLMSAVYYFMKERFSLIGVSVIGAVFHNLGQLLIAYLIISNPGIFYYLPYLTLLAIPTGIAVGLITYFTTGHLSVFTSGGNEDG